MAPRSGNLSQDFCHGRQKRNIKLDEASLIHLLKTKYRHHRHTFANYQTDFP